MESIRIDLDNDGGLHIANVADFFGISQGSTTWHGLARSLLIIWQMATDNLQWVQKWREVWIRAVKVFGNFLAAEP